MTYRRRLVSSVQDKASLCMAQMDIELELRRNPSLNTLGLATPKANKCQNENYKEVFICHAQLYVFAEEWDILRLRAYPIDQLRAVLGAFTLHQCRTGDIIELVQYVYTNTTKNSTLKSMEGNREQDPLQAMVVDYGPQHEDINA